VEERPAAHYCRLLTPRSGQTHLCIDRKIIFVQQTTFKTIDMPGIG